MTHTEHVPGGRQAGSVLLGSKPLLWCPIKAAVTQEATSMNGVKSCGVCHTTGAPNINQPEVAQHGGYDPIQPWDGTHNATYLRVQCSRLPRSRQYGHGSGLSAAAGRRVSRAPVRALRVCPAAAQRQGATVVCAPGIITPASPVMRTETLPQTRAEETNGLQRGDGRAKRGTIWLHEEPSARATARSATGLRRSPA
jgi:hypothetical protein